MRARSRVQIGSSSSGPVLRSPPVIRRLHFQGFKSLADVEFDLGLLNVIVGANGSGKTNLLEAIGLTSAAVFGHVDDEALIRRGVRPGLPTLYKTAFKAADRIRRAITLEVSDERALYRVLLDNPIKSAEVAWRYSNESIELDGGPIASRSPRGTRLHHPAGPEKLEVDKHRGLAPLLRATSPDPAIDSLLEALERFMIFTPFTPMLRGTTPDSSAARPLGLMGGGLADAVRELAVGEPRLGRIVAKLIDWSDRLASGTAAQAQLSPAVPRTRNVLRFHDRHMVEGRDWLSAFDASEGALYVTFLAVLALHHDAPPLAAVDNVDQALNPRLAKALIEEIQAILLEGQPGAVPQLILTAHNPLVLDALNLADERVRLFVMDRNNRGETVVRRIEHAPALERARKEGMTLSRLWLSGLLGGVPNL